MQLVIPGLTKPVPYLIRGNPVFSYIPAFARMTCFIVINDTALKSDMLGSSLKYKKILKIIKTCITVAYKTWRSDFRVADGRD